MEEGVGNMELNSKVKELEDELKILKAEIRNVLLDIREVILDRTNPISDEHQSAFIRMDLNTTARAMAAEAGAREAMHAASEANAVPEGDRGSDAEASQDTESGDGGAAENAATDTGRTDDAAAEVEQSAEASEQPSKSKGRRLASGTSEAADDVVERAEIPAMFRASASSAVSLASWVTKASHEIGAQQVDRVITIHRLCGTISPNVSEALAHVQELIRSSDEEEPAWLGALRDLESLT